MDSNSIHTVGVLGVDTMGAGIVQLAAQTGHAVFACDSSVEALEKAQLYVRNGLSRFVKRGAFSEEEAEEHYDRIHWTVDLEDMAKGRCGDRGYRREGRAEKGGVRYTG